ncbi:hypothetical protein F0562_013547 [Nyssa sinensis]|uniref:Lipoxygenase domain-containing protein n=1 Tax=Nyssa sinensis TaxID=561372 RepID=A0A5J4ZQE6_9ASTE|nr:hypothetical protein F0562_013547 [Nyssa sinensis]
MVLLISLIALSAPKVFKDDTSLQIPNKKEKEKKDSGGYGILLFLRQVLESLKTEVGDDQQANGVVASTNEVEAIPLVKKKVSNNKERATTGKEKVFVETKVPKLNLRFSKPSGRSALSEVLLIGQTSLAVEIMPEFLLYVLPAISEQGGILPSILEDEVQVIHEPMLSEGIPFVFAPIDTKGAEVDQGVPELVKGIRKAFECFLGIFAEYVQVNKPLDRLNDVLAIPVETSVRTNPVASLEFEGVSKLNNNSPVPPLSDLKSDHDPISQPEQV